MRQYGIEPIVITIEPEQLSRIFSAPLNQGLSEDLESDIQIHHLNCEGKVRKASRLIEFLRIWCRISDGFYRRLRRSHSQLLQSDNLGKVDVIYASLPPFGAGELALQAKKVLKKPLVLDMRDAWSQWGSSPFSTYLHFLGVRWLENRALKAADRVIAVTPQLRDMLSGLRKNESAKFSVIPNAVDSDTFPSRLEFRPKSGEINIGYVGGFYFDKSTYESRLLPWYRKPVHHWMHYYATNQNWLYRTPHFFFQCWRQLRELNGDVGERLRFHLIGDTPPWLHEMATTFGVRDHCIFHGRVLKNEVRDKLSSLDFLLSTSIKDVDGEDYCLASKTFDYVSSGKPVLGFVCEGAQKSFLEGSRTGYVFDPDNPLGSAKHLERLLTEGFLLQPNVEYLKEYTSKATCRKLSEVIRSVVGEGNEAPRSVSRK